MGFGLLAVAAGMYAVARETAMFSIDSVVVDGAPPKGTGFGQKLIRAMASQMEGRFSLFRHDGLTCAELRLPPEQPPRAMP